MHHALVMSTARHAVFAVAQCMHALVDTFDMVHHHALCSRMCASVYLDHPSHIRS
eukprot:m.95387 g.95387  ORF g.95387 m.95387 type:complete len:55 (+) comp10103_c0_seq1:876-1040(+)